MTKTTSPKAALLLGAAWAVALRWSIKGIGFVSTVVMARLLAPDDYGTVAMAMLAVGLIQAIVDFGASVALMRKGDVTRAEIDSAWSLTVVQGLITCALIVGASPFIARYFNEPRVLLVLSCVGVSIAVNSFTNFGLVLAQKQFDFSLYFRHQVVCKVAGVVATVAVGYLLRDYRALVAGIAVSQLASVIFSYTMHPYRPRWDTSQMGEIWRTTKWLMLSGIGTYILRRSDEMIAARVGTTREYGLFNVGADFGQLPTGEVGPSLLRAFLPVLASLEHDPERANQAVIKTASAVNTVTLAIGIGFAAMAIPATQLVLGSTWLEASPFVAMYALISALQMMSSPLNTLLITRGHTRTQSHVVWLEFAAFLALALGFVPHFHLIGLAYARLGAGMVSLTAIAWFARSLCGLHTGSLVAALGRPLLGAALMAGLMHWLAGFGTQLHVQVALQLLAGAATYVTWSFVTWHLIGRPQGLESTLIDAMVSHRVKRGAPTS